MMRCLFVLYIFFYFFVAASSWASPAIVYTGKLQDSAYNSSLHLGIEEFRERTDNDCLEIEGLVDGSDYIEKILYCIDQKHSPIILPYSGQFPELINIIHQNKKIDFIFLDFGDVDLPNVWAFSFADNEGAFLAGALAALMTQSKIVGFVFTSSEYPVLLRFRDGYRQGVKAVDPDIQVLEGQLGNYKGVWHDTEKSKKVSQEMIQQGADVLFSAAGHAGQGVLAQAAASGIYAIGTDTNQNLLYPGTMIGSMIKRNDKAIYIALKLAFSDIRKDGIKRLGLMQQAMTLEFDGVEEGLVPETVKKRIESLKAEIARGSLNIN